MKEAVFIVLNYNDANVTINLVDNLCTFSGSRFEQHVIVVDNCSPDGSLEVLVERYKDEASVDVIGSDRNGGYSYGNNYGARYAIERYHPDYLAISNPDIWIDEETVAKLLETFDEDDKLCACAPVMKDLQGHYRIASLKLPDFKDDLKACFTEKTSMNRAADKVVYLNHKPNMLLTDFLPGSFFIIRSDVFEEVGMFDEGVFLFCEERMLGHRIKAHGYKAALRTDLFFVHAHSASINKVYKIMQTRKMILASRLYYELNYNHINKIQESLFIAASSISLIYLRVKLLVRSIIKHDK